MRNDTDTPREWPASEFETFPCPNCGADEWTEVGSASAPDGETTVSKRWACRECGAELDMDIGIDPARCARRLEHLHRDVDAEGGD